MKKLFQQIARFGVIGVLAFAIDYGFLYAFTEWLGIHYLISSVLSFSISVIFNYIASVLWVFDVKQETSKTRNFILFIIFSVIGLGINQLVMWLGVESLGLHYMLVKIFATAVVMVWNFVTRKKMLE
ncbi:MAG: GtrA family protein [Acutalibacteraceae bacterium]